MTLPHPESPRLYSVRRPAELLALNNILLAQLIEHLTKDAIPVDRDKIPWESVENLKREYWDLSAALDSGLYDDLEEVNVEHRPDGEVRVHRRSELLEAAGSGQDADASPDPDGRDEGG